MKNKCSHPLYRTWVAMIERCDNPNSISWKHYGRRGVAVCVRWLNSFDDFVSDMGPKPTGHQVDRKDTNGNYCPENCRWATRKEQNRNRRDNVFIEWRGESLTVIAWAERLGISRHFIDYRLEHGWSPERIFTTPTIPRPSDYTTFLCPKCGAKMQSAGVDRNSKGRYRVWCCKTHGYGAHIKQPIPDGAILKIRVKVP